MNELEARATLARHIERYRSHSYEHLATFARLGRKNTAKIAGIDGGTYQI
jgi:hypothetical protein